MNYFVTFHSAQKLLEAALEATQQHGWQAPQWSLMAPKDDVLRAASYVHGQVETDDVHIRAFEIGASLNAGPHDSLLGSFHRLLDKPPFDSMARRPLTSSLLTTFAFGLTSAILEELGTDLHNPASSNHLSAWHVAMCLLEQVAQWPADAELDLARRGAFGTILSTTPGLDSLGWLLTRSLPDRAPSHTLLEACSFAIATVAEDAAYIGLTESTFQTTRALAVHLRARIASGAEPAPFTFPLVDASRALDKAVQHFRLDLITPDTQEAPRGLAG